MKKTYSNFSLGIFALLCMVSAVGIVIFMNTKGITYTSSQGNVYVMLIFIMSGIAAIIAGSIGKGDLRGLCIIPRFKGNGAYYVIAWLSPVVLAAAGGALYFLLNPGDFDRGMSMMVESLSSQGVSEATAGKIFKIQLYGGLFLTPFFNMLTCGMEEIGFRGFLFTAVKERTSQKAAILITSISWAIWYMPLAAIGYRYGRQASEIAWKGMAFIFLFCVMTGIIACYFRIKTGSIIPGALFRSVINGFSAMAVWFMARPYDVFVGPDIWGIIGGLPLLLFGLICFFLCRERS